MATVWGFRWGHPGGDSGHPVLPRDPESGCHHHHPQHAISIMNRKKCTNSSPTQLPRVSRSKPSPCTQQESKGWGHRVLALHQLWCPPVHPSPTSGDCLCSPAVQNRALCKYHSPDCSPQRGSPEAVKPAHGHPLNTKYRALPSQGDTGEQRNPQSPWARGDVSAPLPPSTKVLQGWRKHGREGAGVR